MVKAQRDKYIDRVVEMVKANPSITYAAMERELGLTEGTLSQWNSRNTGNFADRYSEALKTAFCKLEGKAIQSLGELVEDKNFQAVKYVLDNRGYKPEDKIELSGNTDININIG